MKIYFYVLLSAIFFIAKKVTAQHVHYSSDPRGTTLIHWQLPHISKVISAGWGFSYGVEAYPRYGYPKDTVIDGRQCITGSYFAFDVADSFAYNTDEDITIHFLLHENGGHDFKIVYEQNIIGGRSVEARAEPAGNGWLKATAVLTGAQFANAGHGGTDFSLIAEGANPFDLKLDSTNYITLADIKIIRSNTTPKPAPPGFVNIITSDDNSNTEVPVRLGIYDTAGRMPLPSEDALHLPYMDDIAKRLFLRNVGDKTDYWPVENRHFFYSNGNYTAGIPAGKYIVVINKGPEYKILQQAFEVKPGDTTRINITLERWINMPLAGWYSGDAHIHITRPEDNNSILQQIVQAEDIHVANLLQMGNAGGVHFNQYAFGKKGQYVTGNHALVSGAEDPRTVHHGHVIVLNNKKSIHNRDEYFLYHKILEAYHKQGAYTGYAHVGREWFHDEYGLAVDIPFGLVDFVEIMQYGNLNTDLWYQFLNLGYRLLPIAGSDFPYLDHPGAVRSYAKMNGRFSVQKWFTGFKSGQTFVTNGPMLQFSVNGHAMGETINLKKGDTVHIAAFASMNTQVDSLDYLELIINGQSVKKIEANAGENSINLLYQFCIDQGSWAAIKVMGKNRAMAHSAAAYMHIDANGHKQKAMLDSLIALQINYLNQLKETSVEEVFEIEYWQAGTRLPMLWEKHKPEIDKRIDKAIKKYMEMLK